jgi:hypothetical protein
MWFFEFIPGTLFYLLFVAAGTGYAVSLFLPNPILKKQVKIVSVIALVVSIYLLGMLKVNNWWKEKAAKLEQQVVELAAKSSETNTVIEKKYVTKTQIVKQRGDDIVQYVDREVVKYNTQCVIPREFVEAHDRAAEQPK